MTSTLGRALPRLYLPLVLLIAAALAWEPLFGGVDFWAHAAIGRWIWQHGAVPHETLFLWGQETPLRWVYHSWLSQLVFYGVMAIGGEDSGPHLALAMLAMVVVVSFGIIWKLWQSRAGINIVAPLIFAFAIWCASARFNPRPEMFSALFLTILLVYLVRRQDQNQPQNFALAWKEERLRVLCIVIMFVLWANFHGGVALGLLLLGVALVCDGLQDRGGERTKVLGVLLLLCVLAINLNPYGFEYWQALKPVAGEMFALIDEWKPLWADPALPPLAMVLLGILFVLAFGAWLKNPARRWSHLAWLLAITFLLLDARRHLWSFSQICLIVMAANAIAFDVRQLVVSPFTKNMARFAVVICLTIWFAGFFPASLRATEETLPREATEFVKQNNLRGRFFVDYLHTSYWQWRFGGEPEVFIDLLNAYDDHLLADYFEIISATPQGLKKLENLDPDYIFFGPFKPDSRQAPLAKFLHENSQWRVLYEQPDGILWQNLREDLGSNREATKDLSS